MKKLIFLLFLTAVIACEEDTSFVNDADFNSISADNIGISGEQINGENTGENYNEIEENPFIKVSDENTSTFSIDADGASYANVRRLVESGTMPNPDAVRTEELINYFNYDYAEPQGNHPISLEGEISVCPWNVDHQLLRIGMKGEHIATEEFASSNIVFLIDVSGSMSSNDKLGLLQRGYSLLVDEFDADDNVAIVTYAGSSSVALESTPGNNKSKIKDALNGLSAGGGTAGAQGILTAYEIAQANYIPGGNNRIIVGTDGDFNVGISDQDELVKLIEDKRDEGVFLTIVGVGTGNYQEGQLEQIANHGNGTFEYLDDIDQAKKVFVEEYNKLYTVAKDVKVQIAFNEELVSEYRLIGYENRVLENQDFEDDTKDAGEIGSDQSITAFYEIKPIAHPAPKSIPTFNIDFRYKFPDSDNSNLIELDVFNDGLNFFDSSDDHRFAAAVASYGLVLRDSKYKGNADYDKILDWLSKTNAVDKYGYKSEFIDLIKATERL